MKLTKTKLKQIIKEEFDKVLNEDELPGWNPQYDKVEKEMTAIWNKTIEHNSNEERVGFLKRRFVDARKAGNELLAYNIYLHIQDLEGGPMEPEVPEFPEL